jgi:uncharacterized membrane-anchored protein
MGWLRSSVVIVAALVLLTGRVHSESNPAADAYWDAVNKLRWQFSGAGHIGSQASILVPLGYAFLGEADTSKFLELNGNLPESGNYIVSPKDQHWFASFHFNESGHVPDDEKLNPDSLLDTLKEHNREQQTEMRQHGLNPLILVGWFIEPHYDLTTKRLEWGLRLRTDAGQPVVNYSIKLLGRRGVMDAVLVSDPQSIDRDTREFKNLLQGYSFNEGERYSEFRSGDKIAEYGLGALIVGGAAAAAAKSGAFKGLAKIVGLGGIAACAAIAGLFKKLFRRA